MNGLHDTAQLRLLSGPRPIDEPIAELHSGVQRLESLVSRWLVFSPSPAGMADANAVVEGLRKVLIEIRAAQSGERPDA